jgi:hypothetical protein
MSFLAPLFLLGLAALAIPVLIHLIQRERKRVVEFPSLMFLRRIPYQSVRRRRIRNWLLLLLRAGALLLIVAAFARPFFRQGPLAASAVAGARELVIVLDQSASMGYGDHWQRARAAARQAVDGLGPDDRATLVLFSTSAEESIRSTPDRVRLVAAIEAARVGSGATRYGPALKLAQSVLARSSLRRREALLISDFQKTGWTGAEEVHFPEGAVLTPVSVASPTTSNLSVGSAAFSRTAFSGKERVTVTAAVTNRGAEPVRDLAVTLLVDGEPLESQRVGLAANASTSVAFPPFTLGEPNVRGTIQAGSDALPQDNALHFVLTPGRPVSVLIVEHADEDGRLRDRVSPSLFLSKALGIGNAPTFEVDVLPVARVTPATIESRAVVVLNDVPFPSAGGSGVMKRFVERGGGLLAVLGERTAWPQGQADLLPGQLGPPVDSPAGRTRTLGFLDYSHPVFELFKAPRSGDFSSTRFFRYRSLTTGAQDRVLARFDNGAVAAAEKRVGGGRVIAWSSTLDDSWNDLALKPVFLPLVHQTIRYLARYEDPAAWYIVGQALDVAARVASRNGVDRIVLTPSRQRIALAPEGPRFVELAEQGFYEVRSGTERTPRPYTVAANLDPAESDLSSMDPQELVAAATGRAAPDAPSATRTTPATPQEAERRQSIWWYLLLAGILLLAGETVLSNVLSRSQRVV